MKQAKTEGPVVQLIGVSKIFQGINRETAVLKDISFSAYAGEMVLVLGPSGSGKSTFLTILAGLQEPTSGEVWLFGHALNSYSSVALQRLRASRIGFIFQTFHLIDALNALENILLVLKFTHTRLKAARARAIALLEQFGVGYLADAMPRTMSQGEKQRVAVARALANNATLIIADEPTGSLSTEQGMHIVRLLQEEAKKGNRCVILASHDQRITEYADRVLYLKDGIITDKPFF